MSAADWNEARVAHAAGRLDPAFAGVADAFALNFAEGAETGAAFAVYVEGECVVDICGGTLDRRGDAPWREDALACVYSSGKAVMAFLVAREVARGGLDYDAPVARWWPEFAAAGKESVTLAEVLSHQAGLCGIAEEMAPETWLDWEAITARLAAMAPLWPPGSANGYHPQTVGYIVGEVLRRVTGRMPGALIAELAAGLDLSIRCGFDPADATLAQMSKPPRAPDLGAINPFKELAFLKPWSAPGRVSREAWIAAEIPASNMHANARSLAAIVHPFANQGRDIAGATVLTPDAIDAALEERSRGDDLVLPFHLSWSAGLMRNINRHFGPTEGAFGHAGFGGSCVVVDPDNRLTAAYVINKMSSYLVGDPRAVRLLDAVYGAL